MTYSPDRYACSMGHILCEGNVYITEKGFLKCKTCSREESAKRRKEGRVKSRAKPPKPIEFPCPLCGKPGIFYDKYEGNRRFICVSYEHDRYIWSTGKN